MDDSIYIPKWLIVAFLAAAGCVAAWVFGAADLVLASIGSPPPAEDSGPPVVPVEAPPVAADSTAASDPAAPDTASADDVAGSAAPDTDGSVVADLAAPAAAKIGRASCRERV